VIRLRKMRCPGHIAHMGEEKRIYNFGEETYVNEIS
jgi:hypothetical protein